MVQGQRARSHHLAIRFDCITTRFSGDIAKHILVITWEVRTQKDESGKMKDVTISVQFTSSEGISVHCVPARLEVFHKTIVERDNQ